MQVEAELIPTATGTHLTEVSVPQPATPSWSTLHFQTLCAARNGARGPNENLAGLTVRQQLIGVSDGRLFKQRRRVRHTVSVCCVLSPPPITPSLSSNSSHQELRQHLSACPSPAAAPGLCFYLFTLFLLVFYPAPRG